MRTPLSGVLGMLTLLSEANLESQFKEMVQIATVCGEQLVYEFSVNFQFFIRQSYSLFFKYFYRIY